MARKKKLLQTALICGFYIGIWWLASALVGQSLLLPSPLETLGRCVQLALEGSSWATAGLTLLRTMAGYLLGVACGVLLAVITGRFSFADLLLAPLRSIVKATPVTSFILLTLLWLTSGMVPVFIAFLMVLPIVWASVLEAIRQTDPKLLEMARVFRFSRRETLGRIYLPSILPTFLASSTTSLGFAWKSGVAAEIIAQPKRSIGYMLYQSKLQIETVDLFAWTLLVILLSMALEAALRAAVRRIRHD